MRLKFKPSGEKSSVPVGCLQEEKDLRIASAVKGRAVWNDSLVAMMFEADFVTASNQRPPPGLDFTLVSKVSYARALANSMIMTSSANPNGESAKEVLQQKLPNLQSYDRTFKVEAFFIASMVGVVGEERLRQRLLDAPPAPSNRIRVKDALRQVGKTIASPAFTFVNKTAQGRCWKITNPIST